MIKTTAIGPDMLTEAFCDSCKFKMFDCSEFDWNIDQELKYSPLLCEKCGTARNKDHGDKTKRVEELEKLLLEYRDLCKKLIDNINEKLEAMTK